MECPASPGTGEKPDRMNDGRETGRSPAGCQVLRRVGAQPAGLAKPTVECANYCNPQNPTPLNDQNDREQNSPMPAADPSTFFLIIADYGRRVFSVEGPMTDEQPWQATVRRAREQEHRRVVCGPRGSNPDALAAEFRGIAGSRCRINHD